MRKSRLILAAVIVILTLSAVPTMAFASGGEETQKCAANLVSRYQAQKITRVEFEEEAVDCLSAPSPVIPAKNELLWGTIAFLIVAVGLGKFSFPAVKKGLQAREDKIRDDLAKAESAHQEAADKAKEYDDKLKDAKLEASRIIEEAKQQAAQVKSDLVAKAEDEASSIREKAHSDAQSIASRALVDIQDQVATLSIDLAEKVVKNSLDRDAQMQLVNGYIAELTKTSN